MDTKLKSNRRISLLLAVITAVAAAAVFMLQYPSFEKQVEEYYKYRQNSLLGDEFLNDMYWSNYVFYKDMKEKADGRSYTYEELYLNITEAQAAQDPERNDYISGQYFIDGLRDSFFEILTNEKDEVMNEIAPNVDYCVIDGKTGQFIKNTGKNIEALAGIQSENKEDLPYTYYVVMNYDSAGNPGTVSVKGKDSDALLKSVQRMMKSDLIKSQFMQYTGSSLDDEFYTIDSYDTGKKILFEVKPFEDVTFIYALTQEQQNMLLGISEGSDEIFNYSWDDIVGYYNVGVHANFAMFLIAVGGIMLVMICSKKYCLYRYKIFRLPVEFGVAFGTFILGVSGELVVRMVYYTNRGSFNEAWRKYLGEFSGESCLILTEAVNLLVLTLIFGSWIYCVNTLGDIRILGIKEFLKERSIIIRICRRIWNGCRKIWKKFKTELLHVDLGEKTEGTIRKIVLVNGAVLAVMCSMWVFGWVTLVIYSVLLYLALKKYINKLQQQYHRLLQATGAIAGGNLNTEFNFNEDLGVFESYKEQLYKIQEGFRRAVDEEVKSQKMKTELITNVSHDLKTPLTAITTYIDLLKEENITEEQRREYILVLEKKSLRLKNLIEDLFEVSKANSKNVTIQLVDVDICNLLRQVYLEYEDRIGEADLIFRFKMPERKLVLKLDSQKTYRIIENLYINIIKYAMPNTRVYVNVEMEHEGVETRIASAEERYRECENVIIELKNMSANEIEVASEELTERFVRGDSARNTEGSGLGLAIARSFTELQGGRMDVRVDGDLFKVTLKFPALLAEEIKV